MDNLHPEHKGIAEEIRSGYHRSDASMGYFVENRTSGSFCSIRTQPDRGRVIVERLEPGQVDDFLRDARRYFENRLITIWIENRECAAAVGPAFEAAGCTRGGATIFLAYTGSLPTETLTPGLTIDPVESSTVPEFAAVKIKGFADSENEPAAAQIADEIAVRSGELKGAGRQLIARLDGEPVAIAAFYEGDDRLIFNLATRVPFRNRGFARHLLTRILADASRHCCRSVVINTNPEDTPIRWYRRLGFTDEVYWTQSFDYAP